jgi:hypothetical protein
LRSSCASGERHFFPNAEFPLFHKFL